MVCASGGLNKKLVGLRSLARLKKYGPGGKEPQNHFKGSTNTERSYANNL